MRILRINGGNENEDEKTIAALSAMVMIFTMLPTAAFAADTCASIGVSSVQDSGQAVCESHTEHDDECGCIAAVEGTDCKYT